MRTYVRVCARVRERECFVCFVACLHTPPSSTQVERGERAGQRQQAHTGPKAPINTPPPDPCAPAEQQRKAQQRDERTAHQRTCKQRRPAAPRRRSGRPTRALQHHQGASRDAAFLISYGARLQPHSSNAMPRTLPAGPAAGDLILIDRSGCFAQIRKVVSVQKCGGGRGPSSSP
jgi:hypothetical protein